MSGAIYALLWLLCNATARICFRFTVQGSHHLPGQGGFLLAANHGSYLDIPLLGCAVPRRVWYMGRLDLFGPPLFKWISRELGWIPIRLTRLDREGFGKAAGLIKQGLPVAIYPEGTRTPDGRLQPGKPGIGVIVEETRCPVVPVYIDGAFDALPAGRSWPRFRRITLTFGEPIDFSAAREQLEGKAFYRHVSRAVMERIAELGRVPPPAEATDGAAAGSLNAE